MHTYQCCLGIVSKTHGALLGKAYHDRRWYVWAPAPGGISLEINQLHMKKKNMYKVLVLPEVFSKIVA